MTGNMVTTREQFRHRLELLILFGLIFFLPLMETPKNLAWLLYLLSWLYNRLRDRNFGSRWDGWDTLIAAWILSGIAVAMFAAAHSREWSGAWDLLRYGLILWLIKRGGYSRRTVLWLLAAITASTMLALLHGYLSLYITHARTALELHSVGHVNHSAIYLTISYGLMLAGLLAYWHSLGRPARIAGALLAAFLAVSIIVSDSRAAVGVMLLLSLLLGMSWLRHKRYFFFALGGAVALVISMMIVLDVSVIEKQRSHAQQENILNNRLPLWNSAVVVWKQYPWFGLGMSNYNQIDLEKVQAWVEESGRAYDPARYGGSSHAHNLYITALAERGVVGLGVLLAVLAVWLYSLLRYLPAARDDPLYWTLWGGSFSAWFTAISIGFVNTTLHHEHALLSMLLLGMWLSYLKTQLKRRTVAA